jgi:hypothetical protein
VLWIYFILLVNSLWFTCLVTEMLITANNLHECRIWGFHSGGYEEYHLLGCDAEACHLLTWWFMLKLFFRPWKWRRYVPPKRRLQFNRLHGVTSIYINVNNSNISKENSK